MSERRVYRLMVLLLVFIYGRREETPDAPKLSERLGVRWLHSEGFIVGTLPPAKEGEDAVVKAVAVADGKQTTNERANADGNPEWAGSAEKIPSKGEKDNGTAEQEAAAESNPLLKPVWRWSVVHDVD